MGKPKAKPKKTRTHRTAQRKLPAGDCFRLTEYNLVSRTSQHAYDNLTITRTTYTYVLSGLTTVRLLHSVLRPSVRRRGGPLLLRRHGRLSHARLGVGVLPGVRCRSTLTAGERRVCGAVAQALEDRLHGTCMVDAWWMHSRRMACAWHAHGTRTTVCTSAGNRDQGLERGIGTWTSQALCI